MRLNTTIRTSFFSRRSLTTRMTLFIVAVFLTGLWSLTFYTGHILRTDMERLLGAQQFSAVSLVTETVNQEFEHRLHALETVAKDMSPALLASPARLQEMLAKRPAFQAEFNGGTFVTGLDGVTLASIPAALERVGVNYMDRDYIVATLKQGKATVGRPVMGKKLVVPLFGMAVPIRSPEGQVIGAFAGVTDLSLPNFLGTITEGHYGHSGGFLIISPQHRLVVTATDRLRVMEALPALGINPLIDRFLSGYEGAAVLVNPLGVEVLSSSKHIKLPDWNLMVQLPTAEAFAPVAAIQQRMLGIAVVFSLLAAGLISWMSFRMVRLQLLPMLEVTRTLATLPEGGKLPRTVAITSQDEIGELMAGFNHLLAMLSQREEEVRQLAFTDALTQLPNRRLLTDRLSQALAATRRSALYGAMIFLDLDNFKPLNDLHGHEAGDLLLIEVAQRLKVCVREVDTVARFGGDEFVLLLSELHLNRIEAQAQASAIAENILQSLAQPYLLQIRHEGSVHNLVEHHCTASIGVALFAADKASQSDVLKWADDAMYQAKDNGRNRVQFYQPEGKSP